MPYLSDPTVVDPSDPNAEYLNYAQLRDIVSAARNLSFTQGAIVNGAKAGNLSANYCVFTSNGTANTEDTVSHNLARIPTGYIVVTQDKAATLFNGTTTWTTTNLYLRTSVASVAWKVLVF